MALCEVNTSLAKSRIDRSYADGSLSQNGERVQESPLVQLTPYPCLFPLVGNAKKQKSCLFRIKNNQEILSLADLLTT